MAGPAITLSYIGNGPSGANQSIADLTSGPKAKTLYAYGTLSNGNTTTASTSAPVYFIDGTQGLGKSIVLSLQSVDAATTYNGTSNVAFYHSVQGDGQVKVGDTVTIAGFSNAANNQTNATVTNVITGAVGISNSTAVAETNIAATLVDKQSSIPVWVDVFAAGNSADTAAVVAAALATPGLYASAVSDTGFTLNWSALATTAQTVHFGCVIAFSS